MGSVKIGMAYHGIPIFSHTHTHTHNNAIPTAIKQAAVETKKIIRIE